MSLLAVTRVAGNELGAIESTMRRREFVTLREVIETNEDLISKAAVFW